MPSDRPTDIDIVYRCVYSSRRRQTHTTHTTGLTSVRGVVSGARSLAS